MENHTLTNLSSSGSPSPNESAERSNETSPGRVDLESYFKRIEYFGPRESSMKTLQEIHLLHPQAIAFENLNPLLGIPVRLDLKSIQQKLVNQQRGGYCFEHNLLLSAVLRAIGFKVVDLAARVQWNLPEEVVTARSHMLLLVEVENRKYIADVGFGGNTLTAPLLLQPDIVQETPHGYFRLVLVSEEYQLQKNVKGIWKALYKFGLQEQLLPDYELSSWYLSNHPDSHFVTSLVAARVDKERRFTLRNNQLTIHQNNLETEKFELKNTEEVKEALWISFKIRVPIVSDVDSIFPRLITGSTDS